MKCHIRFLLPVLALVASANAQSRVEPSDISAATKSKTASEIVAPAITSAGPGVIPPPDYVLGGGDQLQIDVPDLADEFNSDKTFRIAASGDLGLPLVGYVQAGGLTVQQLAEVVKEHLKHILKEPGVTITVTGFGSQPVSVLGSVNTPGIVQIAGRKNLFEVLSLAGGLAPDAGFQVTITRDLKWGAIPLPNAQTDATGQFSIASVRIKDLLASSNTAENIIILPNDKVSVPTSDLVYVVGDVTKPGGFLLNQHPSLSALQVVSLAQGFNKVAAPERAKILRVAPGSPNRVEIAVNLKDLVAGKIPDVQLQPEDILFVPNSRAKSIGFRTIDAMVGASSSAVYVGAR